MAASSASNELKLYFDESVELSGHVSADLENAVGTDCGHQLLALRRRNQKHQWHHHLRHVVKALRYWIETAGSVLDGVFNVEHPNAKSGSGLLARVAAKLFAYNFAFVLVAVLPLWLDY